MMNIGSYIITAQSSCDEVIQYASLPSVYVMNDIQIGNHMCNRSVNFASFDPVTYEYARLTTREVCHGDSICYGQQCMRDDSEPQQVESKNKKMHKRSFLLAA